jgi:predicted nucleotidyltransferase
LTGPVDIRPQDLRRVWAVLSAALPFDAQIFVFGSRASRTARRGSDLDLAVDAGRPLTRAEVALLHDGFEASDLPYGVDVVDLRTVAENFRAIIDTHKAPLPELAANQRAPGWRLR